MERSPPKCPYCKKQLQKVLEDTYETYVFDITSGTYKVDDGVSEPHCPHCHAKLYDVFPDGICNYSSK